MRCPEEVPSITGFRDHSSIRVARRVWNEERPHTPFNHPSLPVGQRNHAEKRQGSSPHLVEDNIQTETAADTETSATAMPRLGPWPRPRASRRGSLRRLCHAPIFHLASRKESLPKIEMILLFEGDTCMHCMSESTSPGLSLDRHVSMLFFLRP
jgi:hypothetical protein